MFSVIEKVPKKTQLGSTMKSTRKRIMIMYFFQKDYYIKCRRFITELYYNI